MIKAFVPIRYNNYIIRPIEPKDNPHIESVIRTCLIEFGGEPILSEERLYKACCTIFADRAFFLRCLVYQRVIRGSLL